MFYIEDYLETLANFQNNQGTIPFVIERSDYNLITSLGRQTLRGIGLTDRQYELVKQKLLHYKNQFEANGYENIQLDFENLRTPIRSIDRSRWIKIVDIEDQKYLGVRFSFNKKTYIGFRTNKQFRR
jgi:GH25 family lysozyme M1 (1,4-beta-N-acetylmuramidase)